MMAKMRKACCVISAMLLLLVAAVGNADVPKRGSDHTPQTRPHDLDPGPSPPSNECSLVASRLADIQKLAVAGAQAPWTEASAQLASIQAKLDKPLEGALQKMGPALIAFIGVIIGSLLGGLANWKIQSSLATKKEQIDVALATAKARQDISSSFVEWQLRQLFELYGPLRAHLGQSHYLYDQMKAALIRVTKDNFQIVDNPDDPKRPDFKMRQPNGDWVVFKTVLHLGQVYGKSYGVDNYFDDIVGIGEQITRVIQEKAGFARPDHKELIDMFAQYLAHFSILKRVHSDVQDHVKKGTQSAMVVLDTAAFPRGLEGLIGTDYQSINRELEAWRNARTARVS
jgi:hypothetical protein